METSELMKAVLNHSCDALVEKKLIKSLLELGYNRCVNKNSGSWDGSEPTRDLYEDILSGLSYINIPVTSERKFYLLLNPKDEQYTLNYNSDRVTFREEIRPLFNGNHNFIIESAFVPIGIAILFTDTVEGGVALINTRHRSRFTQDHELHPWVLNEFNDTI